MSFADKFSPSKKTSGSFAANIARQKALVCEIRYDWKEEGIAWYIFEIDAPKRQEFEQRMQQSDPLDLDEFGTVLHSGWGEPTQELKDELNEKYGLYENE